MARRRKTTGEPFAMVPESWFGYLHDAKVSGVEIVVFLALIQHPQRNGLLSRPVADYGEAHDGTDKIGISTITHIQPSQVTHALSNLCTKRLVTLPDGTTATVLTPVVKGHRGRVAVYRCNLPKSEATTKKSRKPKPKPEPKPKTEEESTTEQPHKATTEKHDEDTTTVNIPQSYHLDKKQENGAKTLPLFSWLR